MTPGDNTPPESTADGLAGAKAELETALARARELGSRSDSQGARALLREWVVGQVSAPDSNLGVAALLKELGYDADADAVLAEGSQRHPGDRHLAATSAWSAYHRRDWPQAALRWQAYCQRFDAEPIGYAMAGAALLELGKFDEADGVLTKALLRQFDSRELLATYARVAGRRTEWAQAAGRWNFFRNRYPDDPIGVASLAQALGEQGLAQIRKADALLEEGLRLHPSNPELIGTHARLAQSRGAWVDALTRWKTSREQRPDDPVGYSGIGNALRELGRFEEADAVLSEAVGKFPHLPELASIHARLAEDRQDWAEALRRWQVLHELRPDDLVGYTQIETALRQLGRIEEAEAIAARATERLGSQPHKSLFLRFESLGGDCQFGIVQGRFGALSLGLLRFTSTPLDLLAQALENRLEGVGEPDNTKVTVVKGSYETMDTRYDMIMHTFISEYKFPDIQSESIKFLRRLKYLRGKLLEDLTEHEKIFVYSSRNPASMGEIEALWSSLQLYGNNTLFLVMEADGAHPAGSVNQIRDTLYVGYIDHLSNENPSLAMWLQLCQHVMAAHRKVAPVS